MKKAFRQAGLAKVPDFQDISAYIDQEMLPLEYKEIQDNDGKCIGMRFATQEFITNYLRRFVIAQKKLGEEIGGGLYSIDFNTGADGSRHTKYEFKDGAVQAEQMLATGYVKYVKKNGI